MAVTDVKRIDHTAKSDLRGTTCYETYRVTFDAVPSDITDALTATDGSLTVPGIGAAWTGSTTITCREVGPVRRVPDSNLIYEVPCMYSNISGGGVVTDDPLSRPASIEFGFETVEIVAETDNEDNGILNSAGEKFDPPLTDLKYYPKIVVERNVSEYTFSPSLVYSLMNTTNSAAVTIAGITLGVGEGLLRGYGAVAIYEGDEAYIRERFEILLAETHAVEVADMGYYYIDASDSSKRKRFSDGEGKPLTIPQFLTSGGDDAGGTERYITFNVKDSMSWAGLGLPSGFPDT